MLHITLWLWHTANACLSVESREKPYTRCDRSLSSVRKVWVTQIKVQIPVRRMKVDISSVPYVYSENGTEDLPANSLKVFSRSSRKTRLILYNNTFAQLVYNVNTSILTLTYQ